MAVPRPIRLRALKQAADQTRIERRALVKAKKIITRFRLVALKRAESGLASEFTQKEFNDLVSVIRDLRIEADSAARKSLKFDLTDAINLLRQQNLYAKNQAKAIEVVTEYSERLNSRLRNAVYDIVAQGLPTSTQKKLLSEVFDRLGLTPNNPFQIETIVRTQTQIAYNTAKYLEEQQDYVQDILWGYTYVTVGDDRVREEHAALDGVTLPKDDPFWRRFYPPNGWNCRCQVIPVFEKEKIKRPPKDAKPDPGFDFTPSSFQSAFNP